MTEPTEDTLPAEPAVADTSPAEPNADESTNEVESTDTETGDDETPETTAEGDTESDTSDEDPNKRAWQQKLTKQSQELAEQRKAFESARAEFEKIRDTRLSQADNAIQLAARTLQADFAKVDWNTLAQTDPAGYVQKQHEFGVRQAELNQAWQALEAQKAERERESAASKQKRLAEQESALLEAIPEWRDPAKRAAETAEFVSLARQMNVSDSELQFISENGSAGLVKLLRDAMRYRNVEKQLPKSKPVTQAAPPPPKVPNKAAARFDPEKGSMEDFVRWRERQIRERFGKR